MIWFGVALCVAVAAWAVTDMLKAITRAVHLGGDNNG